MSASPALALQKAFYTKLTGSDFQTACGVAVGIWDRVKQGAPTPYVVISDIQDDGGAAQAYDPSELHANLTVWSTKPGKVELHTIAAAVRAALAPRSDLGPPFALEGHRLVTWRHLQTVPMDDADGLSTKAVVRILFETEPLGS